MWLYWLVLSLFAFCLGCAEGVANEPNEGLPPELAEGPAPDQGTTTEDISVSLPCDLNTLGYPVMDRNAYERTYSGRTFYADGRHLGLDLAYPEGTPIYPIGPGIIRAYRPAQGYGTLVVVVEHCTITGFEARNGFDEVVDGRRSFLTIYGHLRKTSLYNGGRSLPWRVGDRVTPYDIIGYIQRDSDNGDGREHVHLGVRLQSMSEAMASDPSAWFRGYDGTPSQRRWFADPYQFYTDLRSQIRLAEFPGAYTDTPFPPDAGVPRVVDAGSPVRDASASVDVARPTPVDAPRPPVMMTMDAGMPVPVMVCGDRLCQPTNFETCLNCPSDCGSCPLLCAPGLTNCGGACVGLVLDPNNCGGCGFRCAIGQSCVAGSCQSPALPPPLMMPVDAGTPVVDVPPLPRDVGPPDTGPRELCNGLDDDGDGLIDETFLCPLGRQTDLCTTSCGSLGYLRCEAPTCSPGTVCYTFTERCQGNADEDCDGLRDCADPDCVSDPTCLAPRDAGMVAPPPPPVDAGASVPDVPVVLPPPPPVDAGTPVTASGIRYEFRVLPSAGWEAAEPFRLRDRWWATQTCVNTGSSAMELRSDGWHRCDLRTRLSPFVGSFFSPPHTDWGDSGNLGTVGNSPERCTPTAGVEWRLTDLGSGVALYHGSAAGLPCQAVGSQDRHALP